MSGEYTLDYNHVKRYIISYYNHYERTRDESNVAHLPIPLEPLPVETYKCSICYDTTGVDEFSITLSCCHEFHVMCIEKHTIRNHRLCPLCRTEINDSDYSSIIDEFITCKSGKRYKKYGRTFNKMSESSRVGVKLSLNHPVPSSTYETEFETS